MQLLLTCPAVNVKHKNIEGSTALSEAVRLNYLEIKEMLEKRELSADNFIQALDANDWENSERIYCSKSGIIAKNLLMQ